MLLRGVIVVYVICSSSLIVYCQESPESLRNHGYQNYGKQFELSGLEDAPSIVVFINRDNADNLTESEDESFINPYLYLDQDQLDDDASFDNPNRRHESYSGMYHFSFDLQPPLKLQNNQQVLNNYKIPSNNIIGYSIKLQHPDKTNKYGNELQKYYSIFNGKGKEDENQQTLNTYNKERENKFELSDEQKQFFNQLITLKNSNDESAFINSPKSNTNLRSLPNRPIVTFLNPNFVQSYAEHNAPQSQVSNNEYTSESETYMSVSDDLKANYEEDSKSNANEEETPDDLPIYAVFPFRYANNVQPATYEPTEVQNGNADPNVEGSYKSEEKIKTITFTEKVPYPIKIEKKVPVPVKIPVDKPYPVFISRPVPVRIHKPVPVPVKVPVPKPYPVQKLVPVPFKVPVPRSFPVPVIKPYPVYVVKRVPFAVIKPRLYPVKVPVEKPVPYAVTYNKYVPVPVYKDVPVPVNVQYQDYKEYGEVEEQSGKESGSPDEQNLNDYTYSTSLNGIKLPIHIPLDKVKEETPNYVVYDYPDKDATYSTDSYSNEESIEDPSSETYGLKQIIYHTVTSEDNKYINDGDKEAKFEEEVNQNNKPLSFQKIVYKSKNPSSLIHHGSYRIKHPKSMHSMKENKHYSDKDFSLSYHTPFKGEEESSEFIDIRDIENEVKPVKENQQDVLPESYLDILKINGQKSEPSMKTHVVSMNTMDEVESKQIRKEIKVKKKEMQRIKLKEVNKINDINKDANKINITAVSPKSLGDKQMKTVWRGSKKYSFADDSEGDYADIEEAFKTDEANSFGQKYQREMTKKEDGVGTQRDESSGARKQRSSAHRVT